MKSSAQWTTYRTRFLVKAKQLSSSLSFVDHLGRQHSGRKGDYLVESSDGVISITPRQIFEDVYVPVLADAENLIAGHLIGENGIAANVIGANLNGANLNGANLNGANLNGEDKVARSQIARNQIARNQIMRTCEAARRKLPQPWRDRRAAAQRLGLM